MQIKDSYMTPQINAESVYSILNGIKQKVVRIQIKRSFP